MGDYLSEVNNEVELRSSPRLLGRGLLTASELSGTFLLLKRKVLGEEQTKLTYPNGKAIARAYDKAGRLERSPIGPAQNQIQL